MEFKVWQRQAPPRQCAGMSSPKPPQSTWSALRHPAFAALWRSGSLYFVANAMQTMAAAWMMLQLTGSSFLAALVQTAVFLPMFLLSLPAGVLADITDRRRLMLGALSLQAATSALLAALLFAGVGGPAALLFFVFLSGACTAMLSPAWNSTVADSVPRDELRNAITAVAIAHNGARALGPARAGAVCTLGSGT
jgi:MFS family permease